MASQNIVSSASSNAEASSHWAIIINELPNIETTIRSKRRRGRLCSLDSTASRGDSSTTRFLFKNKKNDISEDASMPLDVSLVSEIIPKKIQLCCWLHPME